MLAADIVRKLGVDDKVGLYLGNALDVDYCQYDAIVVANIARPQMKILAEIAKCGNVKMVIARQVLGLVALMYSSYDADDFKGVGLDIVTNVDPNDKKSIHQSVLLKKV